MKYYGKMSLASLLKISLDIIIIIGLVVYFILSKQTLMGKTVDLSSVRFIITTWQLWNLWFLVYYNYISVDMFLLSIEKI